MQAEIITIGTELLLGQIVDTNAAYLAKQLASIGFNVFRSTTIGDNQDRIAHAVRRALDDCDVVITSGGIGPTIDDKTRAAVAAATGRDLVFDQGLLDNIRVFFDKRGWELGENNSRQAFIPQGAVPVLNPVGTAPGFIVEQNHHFVISLPGVPRELTYLMEHSVLPFIHGEFGLDTLIDMRVLRTAGAGESFIDRLIADLEESENPTVGLLAYPGAVDIRVTAKAGNKAEARDLLDTMEKKLRDRLGDMVYGLDEATIEGGIVELLLERGLTLAILETNTGGALACRLTAVPHGLEVLGGALVASLTNADTYLLQTSHPSSAVSTAAPSCWPKKFG
ncbi:MAG: CinA family nicotinamide mononucleotide deamidase-related protein [Deltaproteobacteria bacterium]|jgi:nicotinamide-nucleotide amidase|nr:CinA family nicotinamide mononucleotide deamidase-related protein [Deltaproteobacteria bacterium]